MNDFRPVGTDGTVWGKKNALPQQCQNPVWMIQQRGTVPLVQLLPARVDLPGNSTFAIGDSSQVESTVSAIANGQLVTPIRHVLPDSTKGLPQAADLTTPAIQIGTAFPAAPTYLLYSAALAVPALVFQSS